MTRDALLVPALLHEAAARGWALALALDDGPAALGAASVKVYVDRDGAWWAARVGADGALAVAALGA